MDTNIIAIFRKSSASPFAASRFGVDAARAAKRFHESFPTYEYTPLHSMARLARHLGLKSFYVKDESYRFGLNAFKALGGVYALGRIMTRKLGDDPGLMNYQSLISPEIRRRLGDITFVTATDGNHGRGLAWAAHTFGQKSVVYMPKGSAHERLENIRAAGAEASITDLNYDDAVRRAGHMAREKGWILVQDTVLPGYTDIPSYIMQGYTTMALEAAEQLPDEPPTYIFLQAGVGAMAGAVTAFFRDLYRGTDQLKVIIVETSVANCLQRTAQSPDGNLQIVTGDMDSIMAGLCCGEPCSIGWDILKDHADCFISCPDYVAADGMRLLGNPPAGDPQVISGESGAVTAGLVYELMSDPKLYPIRQELDLNKNSRVLCFSTEGATDTANYRSAVWEGRYPNPSHLK